MTLEEEQRRGHEAKRILDSPLWAEAYESLAKRLNTDMLNGDDDTTLEAKRRLLALYDVRKQLETVLRTGALAEMQLQEGAKDGRNTRGGGAPSS
jgi:hypothetical protein